VRHIAVNVGSDASQSYKNFRRSPFSAWQRGHFIPGLQEQAKLSLFPSPRTGLRPFARVWDPNVLSSVS